MSHSENPNCPRCGRTLVRLASGVLLTCTACVTPIAAPSPPDVQPLPAVTVIRSVQSPPSPVRYYSVAELEQMGQIGSSLDDHDMPEVEGTYWDGGLGVVGTAPAFLMRGGRMVPWDGAGAAPTAMLWPSPVSDMPKIAFGWETA